MSSSWWLKWWRWTRLRSPSNASPVSVSCLIKCPTWCFLNQRGNARVIVKYSTNQNPLLHCPSSVRRTLTSRLHRVMNQQAMQNKTLLKNVLWSNSSAFTVWPTKSHMWQFTFCNCYKVWLLVEMSEKGTKRAVSTLCLLRRCTNIQYVAASIFIQQLVCLQAQ